MCFFFFKQKTAYEMRISDWSSDVCSSDLAFGLQLYFSLNQFSIFSAGDNPNFSSYFEASEWVGLELFELVFTDAGFGAAIIRSLAFSIGATVGCFLIGFGLALLMYRPFRGRGVYYIFFILPMLTVPIVIAYTGEKIGR